LERPSGETLGESSESGEAPEPEEGPELEKSPEKEVLLIAGRGALVAGGIDGKAVTLL
jgi:hypothetical protein